MYRLTAVNFARYLKKGLVQEDAKIYRQGEGMNDGT